jgi:GT2 family glycosyltransferase
MNNIQEQRTIALSVVRYGDVSVILRLVDKLGASPSRRYVALAITDNGPEKSLELVRLQDEGLIDYLGDARHNPGYFPSAFAGLRAVATDEIRWNIIANPDLDIDLSKAILALSRHGHTAPLVIAPQVLENSGSDLKNPHIRHRPSVSWFASRAFIHSTYPTHWAFMKLHQRRRRSSGATTSVPDLACSMYAPHGSIVAMSRPAMNILAPDSNKAVLYSEEIWLGERCHRRGIPITHDPDWRVAHESHSSTGTLTARSRHRLWRAASIRSLLIRLSRDGL